MSVSRVMALGASLVCSVENTRCPVSAERIAMSAVSRSRISPTMITSGSWRTMCRSPAANVSPICGLTWIWLIPSIWYSTGSSIVIIFLVTGPTGSGKSTTLYSALKRINLPDKKIITIEDPVEYQMDGINQIHVNPQIGLTFASGLRHIVRQDPDVIMVGEIRDRETADVAIRAALI